MSLYSAKEKKGKKYIINKYISWDIEGSKCYEEIKQGRKLGGVGKTGKEGALHFAYVTEMLEIFPPLRTFTGFL